jgi:chromosome segregation ATPase
MMTQQQPTPSNGSFLRAVVSFFRFLVRLLFVLVVGTLRGLGFYYGVPWAYRNVVQPVQQNSARIVALEQRMAQEQNRLQEENRALQERMAALETEMTLLREEAAVQTQAQQASEERIQQLEGRASQTEGALGTLQGGAEQVRQELEEALVDLSQQTEGTQERLDGLEGRLVLLQTAQDLLKVRILLMEDNTRGARDALALAVTHVEQAILLMPAQAETLAELQERMVEMDDLIAARSFRVGSDLEALWADVTDLVVPQP